MKIKELDGIRGIAVLFVFLTHMVVWNSPYGLAINLGQAGVYIFFVLSSYFMFTQFLKLNLLSKHELKKFYTARFFRLYPLYIVSITLIVIFFHISGTNVGYFTYLYNVLFLQGVTQLTDIAILSITWTLVVEIQLYIFVPLLGVLFFGSTKQNSKKRIYITMVIVFVTSVLIRFYFVKEGPLQNYFFLYLDLFTIGALVAYKHYKLKELKIAKKSVSFLLCVLFVVLSILSGPRLLINEVRFLIILPAYSILLYFIFDYLLFREKNLLQKICSINILVKIGIYGYSIYLMHSVVREFNWIGYNKVDKFYPKVVKY